MLPSSNQSDGAVDVIIATRDRIQLLQQSVAAISAQDYPGLIRTTIVFDNTTPRIDLERTTGNRQVRVMANTRTPGLPGARNTGLLAATAPWVGFCDDDDAWRPQKLTQQLAVINARNALGCVSGIEVHFGEQRKMRIPDATEITVAALSGSRMTGAHPSTYLFDRARLLDSVGLVDEKLPFGYGEDYDLLLRAAEAGIIAVHAGVGADILWHPGGSYFSQRWEAMADGLEYLLDKHPVISKNKRGNAWMEGQRAFALAAQHNQRGNAIRTAYRSLAMDVREPRAYLALLVAAGLIRPATIVKALNARGRGI